MISQNVILSSTATVDRNSDRLQPYFESVGTDPFWRCEECQVVMGPKAGRALVVIPTSGGGVLDESGSAVAFNAGGPGGKIMNGEICTIKRQWADNEATIFWGFVTNIEHDRDRPALLITVMDGRYVLEELRIIGRWISVLAPAGSEVTQAGVKYQQGWPAHFNPGGRPNCLFADASESGGLIPVFAPYPDYGLDDAEAPPDASAKNTSKACYWTLGSIAEYLWLFCGPQAPTVAAFPWLPRVPAWLAWPKDYAKGVDSEFFDSATGLASNNTGNARKGREVNLEGMAVLDALELLLSTAGGWTVTLEVTGNYRATLRTMRNRYVGNSPQNLPVVLGGKAADTCKSAVVTGGTFQEDISNYQSSITGAGQLPLIEQRMWTKIEDPISQNIPLLPAWTSARFDMFRTLVAGGSIVLNGQTIVAVSDSVGRFEQASRILPDVLTTWRINKIYNYQTGTVFNSASWLKAQISRPPWPTQVSMLSDAGAFDFSAYRAPIYVEVQTKVSGGTWVKFPQYDGMEVWDNGIIYIPMLRELSQANAVWWWSANGTDAASAFSSTGGLANIWRRNIRMNLAIPTDHRLLAVMGSGNDMPTPANNRYGGNLDSDRIDSRLQRRGYRDLQQLYACHLRNHSFPRPESLGAAQASDKGGGGDIGNVIPASESVRSDHALLKSHIARAMWEDNRVLKSGRLRIDGFLTPSFPPGTQIKDFLPFGASGVPNMPARAVIWGNTFVCKENSVATFLEVC